MGFGIVFGGLGTVGGHAAAWLLATRHNRCIALTSRSGQSAARPTIINLENVIIMATRYDAASAEETSEMETIYIVGANQSDPSIVTINSGGVLRDAIVQRQTPGRLRAVAGPKTLGKCTPSVSSHGKCPLLAACTFSSVTSLVGNVGQTGYAATNAGADVFSTNDRGSGLPACSIQWGAWAGGGMAVTSTTLKNRLHRVGFGLIKPAIGALALEAAFSFTRTIIAVCEFDWFRYMNSHAAVSTSSFFCEMTTPLIKSKDATLAEPCMSAILAESHLPKHANTAVSSSESEHQDVTRIVVDAFKKITGSIVGVDEPLLDAGLDSLSSSEFVALLDTHVNGTSSTDNSIKVSLPVTLVFDYPTPSALATFLSSQISRANEPSKILPPACKIDSVVNKCPTQSHVSHNAAWVSAVGTETAFDSEGTFSCDASGVVPISRWDFDDLCCADLQAPIFGGYLAGITEFDPGAFGIKCGEAKTMDPQQRRLLSWSAAAVSSIRALPTGAKASEMLTATMGVYVGVATLDYSAICSISALATGDQYSKVSDMSSFRKPTASTATGSAFLSVIPGRIAFTLNTHGTAVAIDTACSSGLVALHIARIASFNTAKESLRQLAGGVNMVLRAETSALFTAAQMISPDGRCKTLDAAANGYVRGEACVVVILEPRLDTSNGQFCFMIVVGSATNQDGRSSTITAPNGPAQRSVILAAIDSASSDRWEISSPCALQMHGTGTALGDPIEVSAALAVPIQAAAQYRKQTIDSFAFSSTKSSITHTESPSGLISIVAAMSNLKAAKIVCISHLRTCNPYVAVSLRCSFPTIAARSCLGAPTCQTGNACVGASAFAFQGTNAHALVVKEYCRSKDESKNLRNHLTFGATLATRLPNSRLCVRHWLSPLPHSILSRVIIALEESDVVGVYIADIWANPRSSFLKDHKVYGSSLFPGAASLQLADAALQYSITEFTEAGFTAVTCGVTLVRPLFLECTNIKSVQAHVCTTTAGDVHIGHKGSMPVSLKGTEFCPPRKRILTAKFLRLFADKLINNDDTSCSSKSKTAWNFRRTLFRKQVDQTHEPVLGIVTHFSQNKNSKISPAFDDHGWDFSPAALDASFQSICTAQDKQMPVQESLRIPASFDAFTSHEGNLCGHSARRITSESWTSKNISQNFKESFKSEHRVKNAIVRGMVVCSTQRISIDIQPIPFRTHARGISIDDVRNDMHITVLSDKRMSTSSSHKEALFSRMSSSPQNVVRSLCKTRKKSMAADVLRHLSQLLEGLQARRSLAALRVISGEFLCAAARSAMLELVDLCINTEDCDVSRMSGQVVAHGHPKVVSSQAIGSQEISNHGEYRKNRGVSHSNGVVSSCHAVEVLRVKRDFAFGAVMTDEESYTRMIAAANMMSRSPSSLSKHRSNVEIPLVVFGGTGALGLVTVKHAVQQQRYTASLVSRTGRCPSLDELTSVYPPIRLLSADVTTSAALTNTFKLGMLDVPQAIFLLANGVLRDAAVGTTSFGLAREVVAAKCPVTDVMGPAITATAQNTTVYFSSIASFLGSAGQIAYSAANSYLDYSAMSWTDAGVPSYSLQWGPWSEVGMATKYTTKSRLRRIGFGTISPQEGASICVTLLQNICMGSFLSLSSMSKICIARVDWVKYARAIPQCRGDASAFLEYLSHVHLRTEGRESNDNFALKTKGAGIEASIISEAYSGSDKTFVPGESQSVHLTRVEVSQRVCSCIGAIIGREIDPDEPFLAAGLDSLSILDASAELSRMFRVELPVTSLFDNPTARALMHHVENLLESKDHLAANQDINDCIDFTSSGSREAVICGFASAGGGNVDSGAPCEKSGVIPHARWDVEAEPGHLLLHGRFGAFLPTPDLFDTEFFGFRAAEAVWADPQQRLILDVVSVLDVNNTFNSSAHGVYVGIASRDYDLILETGFMTSESSLSSTASSLAATATFPSVASGRASYVFDFTGPSVAFDTACSSSLVAVKAASLDVCNTSMSSAVDGAITTGINVILSREVTSAFQMAGMLSRSGRCRTLDMGADGYVRAEECRGFTLEKLSLALNGFNLRNEPVATDWVLLTGVSVNQDGRSSSLTAPNGPAQTATICSAFSMAVVANGRLRDLSFNKECGFPYAVLQMHGTGTPLGDPIEVGAARTALKHTATAEISTALETSKSWAGHAEPAAGALGIFTLCCTAVSRVLYGNGIALRTMNQHVAVVLDTRKIFSQTLPSNMFSATRQQTALVAPMTISGVSAFAFQGTNAHACVSMESAYPNIFSSGYLGSRSGTASIKIRSRAWAVPPRRPMVDNVDVKQDICAAVFKLRITDAKPATNLAFHDHRILGRAIFPAAGMFGSVFDTLEIVISHTAARESLGNTSALSGVTIPAPLTLTTSKNVSESKIDARLCSNITYLPTEGCVFIASTKLKGPHTKHFTGRVQLSGAGEKASGKQSKRAKYNSSFLPECERSMHTVPIDTIAAYIVFAAKGLQYGPAFRSLHNIRSAESRGENMGNSQGGIIAQADPPDSCNSGVMASIVDGSMQLEALSNSSTAAYIPTDAKCVFFHVDVDGGLLDRTSLKGTSVLSAKKSEHFASQNGGIPQLCTKQSNGLRMSDHRCEIPHEGAGAHNLVRILGMRCRSLGRTISTSIDSVLAGKARPALHSHGHVLEPQAQVAQVERSICVCRNLMTHSHFLTPKICILDRLSISPELRGATATVAAVQLEVQPWSSSEPSHLGLTHNSVKNICARKSHLSVSAIARSIALERPNTGAGEAFSNVKTSDSGVFFAQTLLPISSQSSALSNSPRQNVSVKKYISNSRCLVKHLNSNFTLRAIGSIAKNTSCQNPPRSYFSFGAEGFVDIVGGTGTLGMHAAGWLMDSCARAVNLRSRSGRSLKSTDYNFATK
jgi:acyl transferase domain-containing protein/acyl carrier protein